MANDELRSKLVYLGTPLKEDHLEHYGTPRHSGRYPWGSGDNPYQRNADFLGRVETLKNEGMKQTQIAKALGMNTSELRTRVSIARSENWNYNRREAVRLKEKGMSNVAIAKRMGLPGESSVRLLLNSELAERMNSTQRNANILRKEVDKNGFVDVTKGVELGMGISQTRLSKAVSMLEQQGYVVTPASIEQLGTGHQTNMKIVSPPGTTSKEVYAAIRESKVKLPYVYSEDGGETIRQLEPPRSVDSKRVYVRYAEDGGKEKDGLIELRRGVDDISLKNAKYAQVRIAVDGTHYMKGMAMYSDDIPKGFDIVYNTNKKVGTPVMGTDNDKSVMKVMKKDPDNPFGATILPDEKLTRAQRHYIDKDGKEQLSCLNIVNEEGAWGDWRRTLASQFLSKQAPGLAKRQLDMAYDISKDEYDEIKSLTNATVKANLLNEFARKCDADAVSLAAAALPRQCTRVILPFTEIKDTEIYARDFRNGEKVALIRYPHGGIFEIPILTVNNNVEAARNSIGNPLDAVGINHKTAERLSGADFDGDNVIVIPIDNVNIRSSRPLKGLENFEPKSYKLPDSAPPVDSQTKNMEMGKVTNLITDMTLQGASPDEICRAVRHSMVVIDAEKHHLDIKASEDENGIRQLKERYQGGANKGAATLLSRSTAEYRVPDRKEKPYSKMSKEEKELYSKGEVIWEYSGKSRPKPSLSKKDMTEDERRRWDDKHLEIEDPKMRKAVIKDEHYKIMREASIDGRTKWKDVEKTIKSTQMAEAKDAYSLVFNKNNAIERVYADYANKMKALATEARIEARKQVDVPYSPSNRKVYSEEVASLNAKLNIALKNAPLERQANMYAKMRVRAKLDANPYMDDEHIKRLRGQELDAARKRFGAQRLAIGSPKNPLTDREWEAINSGAISKSKLQEILRYADSNRVKQLAMPHNSIGMPSSKLSTAKSMLSKGYSQADVADMLDVSVSTLVKAIGKKDF